VYIATENGRQLDESQIPAEVATTVITLAELNAGVLAATTSDVRAQRLATLESVADMEVLPVDEEAARMWARLRIHLAETGRRVRVNDLWIAAIAASRGLPVVTQDDDFDALDGAANLVVVRI
jgi:predicted nucleic acid-binding protein